jgi:uncharacterized membrane protein (UPF0127 family)
MTYLRHALFLLGLAVFAATPGLTQPANVQFASSDLQIESGGQRHKFHVELADSDERRMLGLMYRTSMSADAGMLFDFKMDQPVSMWMRNTRIPLDMLFIARDGRIVNIAQRTVPFSENTIPSAEPVRAVLELNGGTAERLGIKPGDKVIHPLFRNAG